MGRTIGMIVLVIVVLGLAWMAYRLIVAGPDDGTPCSSTGGASNDGTIIGGDCVPTALPSTTNQGQTPQLGTPQTQTLDAIDGLKAREVGASEVESAQDPGAFLNAMTENNASSYNVLTSRDETASNPYAINFRTAFNGQCHQFVWYRKWLYAFKRVTSNPSTGEKTCHYEADKSYFPRRIRIRSTTPPHSCSQFKYFFTGAEYRFAETAFETGGVAGPIHYCVYDRQ